MTKKAYSNRLTLDFSLISKMRIRKRLEILVEEHALLFHFAALANTNCRYLLDILPQQIRCLRLKVNGITYCFAEIETQQIRCS